MADELSTYQEHNSAETRKKYVGLVPTCCAAVRL